MKPFFVIPFFTLCTSSKSIKLFGGQKFAFFCYRFWRKYVCESSWLITGNLFFLLIFNIVRAFLAVLRVLFIFFVCIILAVYCL